MKEVLLVFFFFLHFWLVLIACVVPAIGGWQFSFTSNLLEATTLW